MPWWNVALGIWLALSPLVITFYHPTIQWNNVAVGAAFVILALFSTRGFMRGLPVLLGVWLYASTFIFGVSHAAVLWSNLAVACTAIIGALMTEAMETIRDHRDPRLH